MTRKINKAWVILLFVFVYFLINYSTNELMIYRYNEGIYKNNPLSFISVVERYIADYNKGNIYYNNEAYDLAITCYESALEKNPPKMKECKIRINLVLSILETIDFDNQKDNKDEVIKELNKCIDILCEDNCADCDGTKGHSEDANTLKEDIENYIQSLEETDADNEEEKDEDEEETKEEQTDNENDKKQQKLKELQEKGQQERNSELKELEENYDIYDNYNQHYEGKYW